MGSLVLRLLTVLLGVLFLFLGHLKLTPQFFPEYHEYIKNEFGKFNKEFPFHRQTGWRPYAKNYRLTLGITEVVCGLLLVLGFLPQLATIVLLTITTNAIITYQKLNYKVEYTLVPIGISFLLVLQLVLASKSNASPTIKTTKQKVQKKTQ